ncbi:MAG: hypothetical protein GVY32_06845 [Gammaproteobacteria bacterium]|jgi:hypothetical protein|nr:hypothetical protein [Gammaproteobacteria bacterium]
MNPIHFRTPTMVRPVAYAAVLIIAGVLAVPGQSATWTVCPSGCDAISIQAAIDQATSGDIVEIVDSTPPSPMTESDVVVDKSIEIDGAGRDVTTVRAASGPYMASARVFHILSGNSVIIRDMTIQFGVGGTNGGCLLNEGDLTLENVTVEGCITSGSGGGLYNTGSLQLHATRVAQSQADQGGGIYNAGMLSIEGCELFLNTTLGSSAENAGGGLYNQGSAELIDCTIEGHSILSPVGSAIFSVGSLGLRQSAVHDSSGVAVFISGGAAAIEMVSITVSTGNALAALGEAQVDIRGVLMTDNARGISQCSSEPMSLVNSTIAGNVSTGSGAGIFVCESRTLRIASSTIAGNIADSDSDGDGNGGGIFLEPPTDCNPICINTTVELRNSIIADNLDDSPSGFRHAHDCDGTLQSDGYNLVEQGSLSELTGNCFVDGDTSGAMVGSDPLLDSLADNHGPTPTHALQPGSPAIDAGDPDGCGDFEGNPLDHDQRGAPRIGTCDLGAFEFGSGPPIFSDRFQQ